jgi:hypothetical protein
MRMRPVRAALVVLVKSLLIAWALLYLAEYFGWSLRREAGGRTVQALAFTSVSLQR